MSDYERYVDRLFDESNTEKIYIKDNDNKEIAFEQLAVVDFEENYYALLQPVTPIEGVSQDEFLIFLINEEEDCLTYVQDDRVADGVCEEFYKMLEELDEE